MKDYTQPYKTPYYAELKRVGIHLPCFLTHIRTDAARIEKPRDARMFRMMFLTPRTDGCCGTIDTRPNTNLIMIDRDAPYFAALREHGIRLPAVLCQIRTEEGREKRRQGVEAFRYKFLTPRADGISNTLTGVQKDNLIMETTTDKRQTDMEYHEHPTKEDLLEYFSQRLAVRKMTSKEAFRLMDVDDADIEKIQAYPFKTYAEREEAMATADKEELNRIKRASICKTAQYKCAGNSIVVSVLYNIFRTLHIPGQPENKQPIQLTLF